MAPLKVPGFGLPINHMPTWNRRGEQHRFPHAIADWFASEGVTYREQTMLEFINKITDKPDWQQKIYNEEIVAKWKVEACGKEEDEELRETSSDHLSYPCFDYCMQELKDKASYFAKHGVVHALDVEATVVKADLVSSDTLCDELSRAVAPLENVPDSHKDWHPGSDGLVLDLVHPSLFPLQYGKSRVLPSETVEIAKCAWYSGLGQVCTESQDELSAEYTRKQSWGNPGNLKPWGSFQWLPSDVKFRKDGASSIQSYVNNLHPQHHSEVYAVLEQAVDKALPLWQECLSFFHTRLRIKVEGVGHYDYKPPDLSRMQDNNAASDDDENDDDDDDSEYSEEVNMRRWLRDNPDQRQLIQPEPTEKFVPFETLADREGQRRRDLRAQFPDGLQIIFKLANIHLTPEQPTYRGSDWHVEGALNEHICATALIYYDQSNISDSALEFRHEVDSETMIFKPGQDEWEAAEDMFGITHEGPAEQDLGKVLTRKGRILAFPNVMQHRVRSFGLADSSKPGYRKILAMFLVDPHIRILSTANVPPQRRDWWAEEVVKVPPFCDLPVELFERIIDNVEDFPMSWEQACEAREALMAERGRVNQEYQEMVAQDNFNFCEH